MLIEIKDEVISDLVRLYNEEVGEFPNKEDLDSEIENLVVEFLDSMEVNK